MDQVRAEYGEDALIISTNKIGNKTEMICAVEEPLAAESVNHASQPDSEGLDISEATSTVASLLNRVAADNASATQSKRGSSKERIAEEFSKELTSALTEGQQGIKLREPFCSSEQKRAYSRTAKRIRPITAGQQGHAPYDANNTSRPY